MDPGRQCGDGLRRPGTPLQRTRNLSVQRLTATDGWSVAGCEEESKRYRILPDACRRARRLIEVIQLVVVRLQQLAGANGGSLYQNDADVDRFSVALYRYGGAPTRTAARCTRTTGRCTPTT